MMPCSALIIRRSTFLLASGILLFCASHAAAGETVPPQANTRHRTDPDIQSIEDNRLVSLYESAVYGTRSAYRIQDEQERLSTLRSLALTPSDTAYLVQAAERALLSSPPDWNAYRAAIHASRFGEAGDTRFVQLARMAFESSRNGKISDAESRSMMDTFVVLSNSLTADAADLLLACTTREFWGDTPFTSQLMGLTPNRCLVFLRSNAINSLSNLPPEIGLPILELLEKEYPEVTDYGAPSDEYVFEYGAGAQVAQALWSVRSRAGLDPGEHPAVRIKRHQESGRP